MTPPTTTTTLTTRRRSIEFERQATKEAAHMICDPAPLIVFSETRAMRLSGEYVTDPMLVAVGRDRRRDAKEELSDCRNHLVWWLEEHIGEDATHDALEALSHVVRAYDVLCREP